MLIYIFTAILLMVIMPTILVFTLKNKTHALKISAICLSIIYVIVLFIGTTFKVYIKNNNLIIYPNFTQQWFSLKFLLYSFRPLNILINIILLFPMGFIVFTFSKKHAFFKTILYAFVASLTIEIYQFILPISRTTELTDLLFNTLGGILSAIYCNILQKFGAFKYEE